VDPTSPQKTRSDAHRNRTRILAEARTAFAFDGLDVTMREVARRCGLGVATLYRHFPTREDLVVAAFAEQVRDCVATVAAAAEDADVWRGITTVVDEVVTRAALDRGFTAALLGSGTTAKVFAVERRQNMQAVDRLIDRAHRVGAVRPDLTIEDFRLVLAATAMPRLAALGPERALIQVRRLAALLLQGIRADPTAPLLPLPTR
jgi:AcrR family transcriptional regulator